MCYNSCKVLPWLQYQYLYDKNLQNLLPHHNDSPATQICKCLCTLTAELFSDQTPHSSEWRYLHLSTR